VDVKGRKAIVFGGTSGIGLAASLQLAELGATVVAVSRDPDKAGSVPAGVELAKCDVTDGAAVEAFLAEQAPYDILISAATGGGRAIGPFMEMDMAGYRASFDKLWGYTNIVRYGASHLPEDGTIVLVSGSPARKCKPGQIALSSVGGAVEAFVRALAPEIAPVRINVVSPGLIDTPMVGLEGQERKDFYQKMTEKHLIPRAGTADEVASGITFVVQNDFVTGTTVDVDGGILLH
jgi:NAD(P)-dependent dehydrogenase (short-subunit alcohol dehydrogenase family)